MDTSDWRPLTYQEERDGRMGLFLDPEQPLPPERRYVLLAIPREDSAPAVAVGYLRYSAGEKSLPYFVIPGVGGAPTWWSDCIPAGWRSPLWKGGGRTEQPGD